MGGVWMMRVWLGGLTLVLMITILGWSGHNVVSRAFADEQPANPLISAQVTEFGYYRALQETERMLNEQSPSGYERTGGEVVLAKQTQQIPIIKDLLFGFKFHITGFPRDQVAAQLTLKVSHPVMKRPDGSTRDSYSYPIPMNIWNGEISDKTGYKFDKQFEMVTGEWKFEYWYKDTLLLSQSFTTIEPNASQLQEAKAALQGPVPSQVQAQTQAQSQNQLQPLVEPQSQTQPQPQIQSTVSAPAAPKPVKQVTTIQQSVKQVESGAIKEEAGRQQVTNQPVGQDTAVSNTASNVEEKPISNKLAPAFQKQILDIMEQYKAMGYGDRLIPNKDKTTTANKPVTEIQTGAGEKAAETVKQDATQNNNSATEAAAQAAPQSEPQQQEGVAQSSDSNSTDRTKAQ